MKDWLKYLKTSESVVKRVVTWGLVIIAVFLVIRYVESVNRPGTGSITPEALQTKLPEEMTVTEVVKDGLPGEYTVKEGDSLWEISKQAYGSGYEWTKVYEANKETVDNPNLLAIGSNLNLPKLDVQTQEYTIVAGDTLWGVAETTCGSGFAWQSIAVDNQISNPRTIQPGTKLTFVCR
jgi:nucleoid-associated protein YgaU